VPRASKKDQCFFLKEVQEQPKVLSNTLARYISPNFQLKLTKAPLDDQSLKRIKRIYITACGTSYHAALTARYIIEELAQLPTVVEPASECGRHHLLIDDSTLAIAVSQSGCSRETLTALEMASRRGATTLALVNQNPSPLAQAADGSLMTLAGQVLSKSSTKAFTSQTLVLWLIGMRFAQSRGLFKDGFRQELDDLTRLPELVRHALGVDDKTVSLAKWLHEFSHAFILASGHLLPMAFEGALKLKEVAKLHVEGYSVGEFGHGPLALVNDQTPIILIAFNDEPTTNNRKLALACKSRGAPLLLISEDGPRKDQSLADLADAFLPLPQAPFRQRPLIGVIPLQLLAYNLGRLKGLNIDDPGGILDRQEIIISEPENNVATLVRNPAALSGR
jgi:glucosamine--fructose-6-phosphate aminotransferase (isomerizing)